MPSAYADRIAELAATARAERERFDPPAAFAEGSGDDADVVRLAGVDVADRSEGALVAARDGLGPVIGVYVDARTGPDSVRFSGTELRRLHAATNDWLAVYARCYGVEVDPDATVREAAEVLLDTRNAVDVASLLTGVPEVEPGGPEVEPGGPEA